MAQFSGFVCDECEKVVQSENRVKVRYRFEGNPAVIDHDVKFDLCPDCATATLDALKEGGLVAEPIPRRSSGDDEASESEAEGETSEKTPFAG